MKITLKQIGIATVTLLMAACGSQQNEILNWVTLSATTAASEGDVLKITLASEAAGHNYTASVESEGDFASFNIAQSLTSTSGEVSSSALSNIVYLYINENSQPLEREAELTLGLDEGSTHNFTITQLAYGSSTGSGESGESDGSTDTTDLNQESVNLASYGWAELPEQVDNTSYQYVTHHTTIDGKSVRNFSICFDKSKYAARWVAFPYHSIYDADQDRTDKWAYDPKIAEEYQANLSGSYEGDYDRGHQVASADRTATYDANAQTFYYSNMTPQWGQLNQRAWATLESNVRGQVCSDTLYVVTGADFSTFNGYTEDKSGKQCPIPNGYYKVLLRTVAGDSGKAVADCTADELKTIGFWFDHKEETVSTVTTPVSVKYIEDKVGFNFFPMIPEEVKSTLETSQWVF